MHNLIEFADEKDLESICTIEKKSNGSWSPDIFESELKNEFSRIIINKSGCDITGFAVVWITADEVQLMKICVTPDARNLGTGKAILTFIRKIYPAKKITLEVAEKNTPALALYRSTGFKETGLRKNYYPDDNALLMDLE